MAESLPPEDKPSEDFCERIGGGYRKRKEKPEEIEVADFYNPWNFYLLFMQDDSFLVRGCVRHGLLANNIVCTSKPQRSADGHLYSCDGIMKLSQRSGRSTGFSLRCNKNRNHECASRKYSFFENSKLAIQDIMVFIKTYVEGYSLYHCSKMSGVHYQSTGVDWGSFVREILKEHFHTSVRSRQLKGEVEIDESLFGRRVKHHRGNPRKGCKIWVFGMVERSTNTVILYPVTDRSEKTLLPLILRHVERGSTIYSDGWSSYCSLNEMGFKHFTVVHKYTFKSQYRNTETGEIVNVHTNRIEGAWKHAKDHFKRMSGTKVTQFEGHLAEVMWRAEVKGRYFEPFFEALKAVYTLQGPPRYTYPTPLFDTWSNTESLDTWEVVPTATDAETTDSEQLSSETDVISVSSDSERGDHASKRQMPPARRVEDRNRRLISELFSSSESEQEVDKTIIASECTDSSIVRTKKPPLRLKLKKKTPVPEQTTSVEDNGSSAISAKQTKSKTEKVCHPPGYITVGKGQKKSKPAKTPVNPYSREGFQWSSNDSDFA